MRGLVRAGIIIAAILAIFILGASATDSAMPAQGPRIHVVRPGETLVSIAARYGTSVSAIMQANGLRNRNFIWTGQRLRIPGTANPAQPTPTPAPSTGHFHVVRPGETLSGIAARYGVSVVALMEANGLSNPRFVYFGQRLVIPGRNTPQPAPPSSDAPSSPTPIPTSQPATPTPQPADSSQPATPTPHPDAAAGKRIEVSLSKQTLWAYENDQVVFSTLVSTGVAHYPTPIGKFKIYAKYRNQTMVGPGYYLPNVPNVMYFMGADALHGTYWHNNFGHPMSHGCVNLSKKDATWLYGWAPVGTEVIIRR